MTNENSQLLQLLKQEREDSSRERKETIDRFLEKMSTLTQQQTDALNSLGKSMEKSMGALRKENSAMYRQLFVFLTITILVVAGLAGVSVSFLHTGDLILSSSANADALRDPQ